MIPPLAAATLGGFSLHLMGLPVGWLVGSMAATAAHNLLSSAPWSLPRQIRRGGEFLLGVSVGSMFTLTIAIFLAQHLLAVAISVGGALVAGLLCGYFLLWRTDLDPTTALYATAAGGAAEMASLAGQQGGDERFVATYHSMRIGLIVLTIPLALTFSFADGIAPAVRAIPLWDVSMLSHSALLFLVGGLGAWLALRYRLPGGQLTGIILAIGLANIAGADLPPIPKEIRYGAQVLIGAGIGCSFDREALRRVGSLLPLGILNIFLLIGMGVVWALILWMSTPMNLLTALLSSAPASAADMTATAIALGGDAPVVAAIQAVRVIFVSLLMPIAIKRAIRFREARSPVVNPATVKTQE